MVKIILIWIIWIIAIYSANLDNRWCLWRGYKKYLHKLPNDISKEIFLKADTDKKIVSITFDDGPLKNTPKLTEYLKSHNIPATFFLLASNLNRKRVKYYNDTLFITAIHGYKHYNFKYLSDKKTKKEIKKAIRIFKKYHLRYNFFRPPYGVLTKSLIDTLKLYHIRPVIWSIDSRDWSKRFKKGAVERVLNNLSPGAIILFHDEGITINQLNKIINGIYKKGYKIVSLDELMNYNTLLP